MTRRGEWRKMWKASTLGRWASGSCCPPARRLRGHFYRSARASKIHSSSSRLAPPRACSHSLHGRPLARSKRVWERPAAPLLKQGRSSAKTSTTVSSASGATAAATVSASRAGVLLWSSPRTLGSPHPDCEGGAVRRSGVRDHTLLAKPGQPQPQPPPPVRPDSLDGSVGRTDLRTA